MKLRELREDRDLTQQQIADVLNCKQTHINSTKVKNGSCHYRL